MLKAVSNVDAVFERLDVSPLVRFTVRTFASHRISSFVPSVVLADDEQSPTLLAVHRGPEFMIAGKDSQAYASALADIFYGRVDEPGGWPGEHLEGGWMNWGIEGRFIFISQSPFEAWQAALEAGFEPLWWDDDDEEKIEKKKAEGDAHLWYITGKPRFQELVKHPCRVHPPGDTQLLEYLKKGIHYDEEGKYLTKCLQAGPSFVCEVGGEPVCWSGTHLSGTMGMIYTPEEHRRTGYAKSLAAFQIDHMLEHYGYASAHVVIGNTPSEELLRAFGATRHPGTFVWRVVKWPK